MLPSPLSASLSSFAGEGLNGWAIQRAARQWGIFSQPAPALPAWRRRVASIAGDDAGSLFAQGPKKVLGAAHVFSLDMAEQSTISTAPQENGEFTSYNKVFTPYKATISFICDGSETGNLGENLLPGFIRGAIGKGPDTVRRDFVATLAALVKDTHLYFIATPERIYKHANIIGYRFNRQVKDGVDVISADVQVQEVRQSRKIDWAPSRLPQGATPQDRGFVSPITKESS